MLLFLHIDENALGASKDLGGGLMLEELSDEYSLFSECCFFILGIVGPSRQGERSS